MQDTTAEWIKEQAAILTNLRNRMDKAYEQGKGIRLSFEELQIIWMAYLQEEFDNETGII